MNSENKPKVFIPDPSKGAEMFTRARIELMREVNKCPELCELIAQAVVVNPNLDWADVLAEITAYCNIMMDGLYSDRDLENLYPQLTHRLAKKRSPLILMNDAPLIQ